MGFMTMTFTKASSIHTQLRPFFSAHTNTIGASVQITQLFFSLHIYFTLLTVYRLLKNSVDYKVELGTTSVYSITHTYIAVKRLKPLCIFAIVRFDLVCCIVKGRKEIRNKLSMQKYSNKYIRINCGRKMLNIGFALL